MRRRPPHPPEPRALNTQTVCQRCGVPVLAGSRFCANCGADVSAEQGEVATRRFSGGTSAQFKELLERVRRATLGEYDILTELGRGGMATVYLAHDLQLDRKVAIKVMLPTLLAGDDMIERFRLEARTAAGLSHPHIIPIYSVRVAEHLVYFVMKFVEGRPLDAILKELGALPIPMAQSIATKVGEALGYAHRRGVVHRDIKPANLMIDTEGLPVVTDFGIAKVADARALTMTGAMIGTPAYMSPEQCTASAITGASDQYSLGVVMHQMLTGRVPFDGESLVGVLYQHTHEAPPSVMVDRPDCPPAIAAAVARMLAKDPAARFPSIEAAVEAIGSVSLAFDHPMRSQLIDLARRGENVAILKRVSTPRSPIPIQDAAGTAGRAPTPRIAPRPAPPRTAPRWWVATGLLAVGGAVALWIALTGRPGVPAGDDGAPATAPAGTPAETSVSPTASEPGTPGRDAAEATGAATAAAIRIDESPARLVVGATARLRATSLDAAGRPLAARTPTWSTANPDLVSLTGAGQLVALAPGVATLTARRDGSERAVVVEVVRARAASVSVDAPAAPLLVGSTARLTAAIVDERGRPVVEGIQWRSADPRVATVVDGLVTAVTPGSTVIVVSADGREGSAAVRVAAAEPVARVEAAPPPTAPRVEPPVVEAGAAITALIQRYARALESRQISEVRRVFPGITPEQESQVAQTLRQLERLRVDFQVSDLRVVGDDATAQVSGAYEFYSPENRRMERLPVRFQATLSRGLEGWQLRSIR